MIELENGTKATQIEQVTALALEARRRGISYGRLVANTSGYELAQIIQDYCASKRTRKNKRKG